ncbi:hypothetical protein LguiA_033778 [Lonicera macranthoides]
MVEIANGAFLCCGCSSIYSLLYRLCQRRVEIEEEESLSHGKEWGRPRTE